MSKEKMGLIATLVLGIFIIIGALIAFLSKKKEKVTDFAIGLAFGVIVMLIITDLLPEITEQLGLRYIYLFIIGTIGGFVVLKLLDYFVPDHEEDSMTKKEAKNNLIHIGMITSLAFILHNMIEGMVIYSTMITDSNLGVLVMLGIGFHNIPLGMMIATTFYQSNQNISKTVLILLGISLSTFFGGLLMFFMNLTVIHSTVLGVLLSLTLGMLIYILFDELYPRICHSKNKKINYLGIFLGVVILFISLFL